MRAALYMRVSTSDQTIENQRRELLAAAEARGWTVVGEYADEGISGGKGREKRPGLDALMKAANKSSFEVIMTWSIDRLGRSLMDLLRTMMDLNTIKVNLFVKQQEIDTTTPSGRLMYSMLGAFAEFERELIRARVNAGLARAAEKGNKPGPPKLETRNPARYDEIKNLLKSGMNPWNVHLKTGAGNSAVNRIRKQMIAAGELDVTLERARARAKPKQPIGRWL